MNISLPDDWIKRLKVIIELHEAGKKDEIVQKVAGLPPDQKDGMRHMLRDYLVRKPNIVPRKRDVFKR